MDFYEVADRIVKLLQQRGRLTYRVLKLQFKLDDETLEALKEEILYSQSQVVDDDGRGLIWTGESETKPESTLTQTAKPEVAPETQPTQSESPPPAVELTRFDGHLMIWEQGGIHDAKNTSALSDRIP